MFLNFDIFENHFLMSGMVILVIFSKGVFYDIVEEDNHRYRLGI